MSIAPTIDCTSTSNRYSETTPAGALLTTISSYTSVYNPFIGSRAGLPEGAIAVFLEYDEKERSSFGYIKYRAKLLISGHVYYTLFSASRGEHIKFMNRDWRILA